MSREFLKIRRIPEKKCIDQNAKEKNSGAKRTFHEYLF
jgi:hypothetical protein